MLDDRCGTYSTRASNSRHAGNRDDGESFDHYWQTNKVATGKVKTQLRASIDAPFGGGRLDRKKQYQQYDAHKLMGTGPIALPLDGRAVF